MKSIYKILTIIGVIGLGIYIVEFNSQPTLENKKIVKSITKSTNNKRDYELDKRELELTKRELELEKEKVEIKKIEVEIDRIKNETDHIKNEAERLENEAEYFENETDKMKFLQKQDCERREECRDGK